MVGRSYARADCRHSLEDVKAFECDINDEMFLLFADLIYGISGIRLGMQKKGLLIARLTKRLKLLGIERFPDYYQRVKNDEEEQVEMMNCISTNTTKFFREGHHFEYVRNTVIPELLRTKAQDRTLRVWSAGCSTGEEPYSLAITVCEAVRARPAGVPPPAVRILATDLSTRALNVAGMGVYGREQLPDALPAEFARRYFLKGRGEDEGRIRVKDFLKGMIRFGRFNLKSRSYPFRKRFDIIFCRNVMIYFDEEMKRHVLSKFHEYLSDEGYLFLGHSETMCGMERFMPVHITVYRKKQESRT